MKIIIVTMLLAVSTALYAADKAALSAANPVERANAAQILGREKDASAVDALTKILNDAEPNVAYAAAQALAKIGNDPAGAALLAALKAGQDAVAGDAALICASARGAAKDDKQRKALLEACYASKHLPVKYTAWSALATIEPAQYASAIEAALSSGDPLQSAAAVKAVKASAALVPAALKALAATRDEAKARIIGALSPHFVQAQVRPVLVTAFADESAAVRIAALHAAVISGDPEALAPMFAACSKGGEEESIAMLMIASSMAKEMDAFLYAQMKQPASRSKAIELLAARHQKELIGRLCDASLYTENGIHQSAAGAFRLCLQAPEFAKAMLFVFTELPADQRPPFVSALSAVIQQLPETTKTVKEISAQFKTMKPEARADALDVLAALQTPEICQLLTEQAGAGDLEYRKDVVRTLTKWSQPVALDALIAFAKSDADRTVKILATRGALTLLDKKDVADDTKKLAVLRTLYAVAERDDEKRLVYVRLKGVGGNEAAQMRQELVAELKIDDSETTEIAINIGGPAVGNFQADADFEGGTPFKINAPIDLSETRDAAPEEVYQSRRYQECTYRLSGLTPNGVYMIRLHYAELFHKTPGERAGDVIVNGVKIIDNLPSRAYCKAFTVTRDITADAEGRVVVEFRTTRNQVKVNGLEIIAVGKRAKVAAVVTPAVAALQSSARPVPGKINILLLTGANNHNWQETTAALKEIFAKTPQFAVTFVEHPWAMKPADIEGYDLIFNNWNTFGSDKREWSAEMKTAFIQWIRKGGGFFVLHAGGSMFYDWEEFHQLVGGTWEKETFHPHPQEFTVNISDKEHPVTRGLKDFQTFDEPWQKLSVRNPERHVLATSVISKENKGSGAVEPFAFTTAMDKGRCFNLVLGHDARALNTAGCTALILRGSEWAATGAVK